MIKELQERFRIESSSVIICWELLFFFFTINEENDLILYCE